MLVNLYALTISGQSLYHYDVSFERLSTRAPRSSSAQQPASAGGWALGVVGEWRCKHGCWVGTECSGVGCVGRWVSPIVAELCAAFM